jgi:hypothetical protein
MRKSLICLLAAIAVPVTAMAGDPPVVEQLRQDLVGKTFPLRIPVAGSTCVQTPGLSFAETSLVDTELDGQEIRYYARANRLLKIRQCPRPLAFFSPDSFAGMYIDAGRIDNMHSQGSPVDIKRVEAKPDRIEIQLLATEQSGDDAYGKIKLMLGKGYESQTLQQLETILAQVVEIPRIRDLEPRQIAYQLVEDEIAAMEASLSAEYSAQQNVDNATKLLALYDREPGAVARLNLVAFTPVQAPDNLAKIKKVQQRLAGFEQQARKEKIDAALSRYAEATDQMKADCASLPKGEVKTRAGLKVQQVAVNTARQDLRRFESGRREMLNLNQSVPDSEEGYFAQCSSSLDTLTQLFPKEEESIRAADAVAAEAERQRQEREAQLQQERARTQELESVDESYRKLKRQRAALDAKLLTALGGPDEYATYSVYRNLLEEMIQNRQQAQSLGSKSAEQEMQSLAAQLLKLQR